jgi:hypothetical protein
MVKKYWTEGKPLKIEEGKAMGNGLFFGYASKHRVCFLLKIVTTQHQLHL